MLKAHYFKMLKLAKGRLRLNFCKRQLQSSFHFIHHHSKYTRIELTNEEEMRATILTWKERASKSSNWRRKQTKEPYGNILSDRTLKSSRWYFRLIFAPFLIKIHFWRPRKRRANVQKNTQLESLGLKIDDNNSVNCRTTWAILILVSKLIFSVTV